MNFTTYLVDIVLLEVIVYKYLLTLRLSVIQCNTSIGPLHSLITVILLTFQEELLKP